jgi:cell division septal protein FtsQ
LTFSIATLVAILLCWRAGEWAFKNLMIENDAFALQNIEIQTDGIISPEQLRKWAGIKHGDNMLALDLARIRRNLELAPLIKEVAVDRVFPRTVKIRVSEREPMAQARVLVPKPDNRGYEIAIYYLDDEGYVMLPLENGLRTALPGFNQDRLSILTGLSSSELCPGRCVVSSQVVAALRLIEVFERSPMFGVADLARIDLSTNDLLHVTTSQTNEVSLALDHLETQLRRWRAVYDYGQKLGKAIASLDLSVSNNLPVVWVEASALPLPKPQTPKPFHYRKKHV